MIFTLFAGADVTPLSADIVMEEIGSLFDLLMVIDCCAGGVTKSFFVLFISRTTILLPERNIGQFHRVTNCEVRVLELILYVLWKRESACTLFLVLGMLTTSVINSL